MTLDHILLIILGAALLYRYHRNELRKAEERFEKCDKERIQLHNFFYATQGVGFTDVRNETPALEAEPEPTSEERYREVMDRRKLELKSLARTRLSGLGRRIRRFEKQGRPHIKNIRPAMDPATAAEAKDKIARQFAEIEHQVIHGRRTAQTGG